MIRIDMLQPARQIEIGYQVLFGGTVLVALSLILSLRPVWNSQPQDGIAEHVVSIPDLREPHSQPPSPSDWRIFQGNHALSTSSTQHPLADRFRLAGTFFTLSDPAGRAAIRKAILDDLSTQQQRLVSEGERIEETIRVDRVEAERVFLVCGGETIILELSYRDGTAIHTAENLTPKDGSASGSPASLESTSYGDRISPNRWVLRRDSLMGYYQEMRDDPERIALLYETFKPVVEDEKITGYQLGIEGEKEFLSAMGLQENDIIRSVNSMQMTSQGRAESFLREFVQGRMSALVIEVERGDAKSKQIYEIR